MNMKEKIANRTLSVSLGVDRNNYILYCGLQSCNRSHFTLKQLHGSRGPMILLDATEDSDGVGSQFLLRFLLEYPSVNIFLSYEKKII